MANTLIKKIFTDTTGNILIQLFRYGIVGGIAFAVDFGLLTLLTEWCGMHYMWSAVCSFIAGLTVNYLISIHWVFGQSKSRSPQEKTAEFILYAIVGVIGLGLNAIIMWTLTEYFSLDYRISKLCSTVLVFMWNFLARRAFLSKINLLCKRILPSL